MREKLIDRLIELAIYNSFFPKSTMRWSNSNYNGKFLREISFDKTGLELYSDEALLDIYVIIIRQSSKQF